MTSLFSPPSTGSEPSAKGAADDPLAAALAVEASAAGLGAAGATAQPAKPNAASVSMTTGVTARIRLRCGDFIAGV